MTNRLEIVGFYSITSDREYEQSASALRYFIKPKLPLDLNKGIERLKEKPDTYYREKMDSILKFIVNHKSELLNEFASFSQSGERLIPSTQYITYRGILRMIMCTRVTEHPWSIIATKYKGNIYLCQYSSQEKINAERNRDITSRIMGNYGPMFEHNCLSELPHKKPDTSEACDASVQFFCVFKRRLANRQFLFAGEMDGTDSETPLNPKNFKNWNPNQFIELKINCELNTSNRMFTFENFKVHGIWAQSYLTGVERVYIGFRDNNGIVKKIKRYSIDELEKISRANWKSSMDGFDFLEHFLKRVEADLKTVDCPYTTIKYDKTSSGISSRMYRGNTEFSLLPKWYLKEMRN